MASIIKCEKGFTLLEMLIAVMILAVGLLGLAQLQVTAIRTNVQASSVVTAAALGQSVLEDIARMPGSDPIFQTAVASYADWPNFPTVTVQGGVYSIQYKTVVDYEGLPNVTKVDIKVESQKNIQTVLGGRKEVVNLITLKRYY